MFCNKCGAQLADSAVFCNKCGNAVQSGKQMVKGTPAAGERTRQKKGKKAGWVWILLPVIIVAAAAVCVIFLRKPEKTEEPETPEKPDIYGTWMDADGAVTFTFQENGTVRISGLSDVLGVELFTFTEVDSDTFQLKANTDIELLRMISVNLNYEISGDEMTAEIAGLTYELTKQE